MEPSSPPLFSWLHLSDIHFGHGRRAERQHRELVLDAFLSALPGFQAEWGAPRPDAIFVTGDVGFSGDALGRDEYGQAREWFHQLIRRLDLAPRSVYFVPGNHDVSRVAKRDDPAFPLIQALRRGKSRLDDVFDDDTSLRLLRGRMENYLKFASEFGPAATELFWVHRLKTRGALSLRIAGLNTALLANDDKDYKKLRLGLSQLTPALLRREAGELVIALSHHPPEWLADETEVDRWLESGADLLLSGHVHDQKSELRQRGGRRRFIRIAAGALHEVPHGPTGLASFAFNFGAIHAQGDVLQLRVWPFVWGTDHQFKPDLSQLDTPGQYFHQHELECPAPTRALGSENLAWENDPPDAELAEALASYKSQRAEDSRIRRLDLSRLVGITRGPAQTELDLLDIVVPPSLQADDAERGAQAAMLQRQLNPPGLESAEKKRLTEQLRQLEQSDRSHPDDRRGGQRESISFAEALHQHRQLIVMGEPGAGKSILTRLSLLACTDGEAGRRARERLSADDVFNPHALGTVRNLRTLMPIRILLGDFGREPEDGRDPSLVGYIRRQLLQQQANPLLGSQLESLLRAGRVFLLGDGFDEVLEAQRERVSHELATFAGRFPQTRLLVTSRPHGYHPRIAGFAHTRLAPLRNRQQRALVSRLHRLVETLRSGDTQGIARARHWTHVLLKAIQSRREWQALSSNPLLLTLSALTTTNEGDVLKHRIFVFENFVRTLLGKWRSTLKEFAEQTEHLLTAWSLVASDWMRSGRRHAVEKARLLRMLTSALTTARVPSSIGAPLALHLALESGLVRDDDGTIAFWHLTFAEFLTARALTSPEPHAAQRILDMPALSPLVLQFAAARLCHVLDDEEEAATLARGLLARDDTGSGRLFRPGLRAVSACMADGVHFRDDVTEQVWEAWVDVLERTPPSPLWSDFHQLAQRATPVRLPPRLVPRLSQLDDHGLYQAREGMARLVAPFANENALARAACENWLRGDVFTRIPFHGAQGLARAGVWTEAVLTGLGRLDPDERSEADSVHALVRKAGAPVLAQLRALVQEQAPPEGVASGSARPLSDTRISAAALLALTGHWNEEVTGVMKQALSTNNSSSRQQKLKAVIRHCADQEQVRQVLFHWLFTEPTLHTTVFEILRDVAPRVERMPEELLELTARAEGELLSRLESLLVSVGEERRALVDLLRHWLEDEREERKRSAARVLLQLVPGDALLQKTVRQGMGARSDEARVSWARLASHLDEPIQEAARDVMRDSILSPEAKPRREARAWMLQRMEGLTWVPSEAWLARASARSTSEAARLDAAQFLVWSKHRDLAPPLLKRLLDTAEDEQVKRETAHLLFDLNEVDARVATLTVQEAMHRKTGFSVQGLAQLKPYAELLVPFILQTLSEPLPLEGSRTSGLDPEHFWSRVLKELVMHEPSCVLALMRALESPGLSSRCAEATLDELREFLPVRSALLQQLQHPDVRSNPNKLSTVLGLLLIPEETKPLALEVLRTLTPQVLEPSTWAWLAQRIPHEQEATRLWSWVLEGEDLDLSLRAAMELVLHFPDGVPAALPPTLPRLLQSPDIFQRIDAARLALRCGLLEQEALDVLLECLSSRAERHEQRWPDWNWHALRNEVVDGDDPYSKALRRLIHFKPGADMEAMHVLCVHRPSLGLPRLASWLGAGEESRLKNAVRILLTRGEYRDRVRLALEEQLASAPLELIDLLVRLVDEHGLHSVRMTEQLLSRFTPHLNESDRLPRLLGSWLNRFPEHWSLLLKPELSRRAELMLLLVYPTPVHGAAIAFALDMVLSHPYARFVGEAMEALQRWTESTDESPSLSPEEVRVQMRALLLTRDAPRELLALHRFDWLARRAELPIHRRIEVLLRALDVDLAALEGGPFSSTDLLWWQVSAGILLHELGSSDDRIQPLLESSLPILGRTSMDCMFHCASALVESRLSKPETKRLLIQSAVAPLEYFRAPPEKLVALLTRAGMSSEDILGVQLTSLGLDVREEWTRLRQEGDRQLWNEPSFVEKTLDHLDCPAERRAAILHQFVSTHAARFSDEMRLSLAARPDMPEALAAKLLLHLLARPGRDRSEALERWRERFELDAQEDSDGLWPYSDYASLSMQFDMLEKLWDTPQPGHLLEVLLECAAVPADTVRPLYEAVREGGRALSDPQWLELTRWLSLQPSDERIPRFAKQWLTAGLWREVRTREADVM